MDLPEKILELLDKSSKPVSSVELAEKLNVDYQKIVGAIKSLEALGDYVNTTTETQKTWALTGEGTEVSKRGSHEALVFQALPAGDAGLPQSELMSAVGADIGKVGLGKAMSQGWVTVDKSGGKPVVKRKVQTISDTVQANLKKIAEGQSGSVSDKDKSEYKKRKLMSEQVLKVVKLSKGSGFKTKIVKAETELTPEMISSGSWKTTEFKPFNFDTLGIQPPSGYLHPLLKVRTEFRQIFLEMGFSEMPTNNFVESSFWNFDALFQPQQHPARDAHDTFFISDPAEAKDFPMEYLERVKKVHSKGGFGSQGYGYDWKIAEAQKNLLRTHTTAVSARMLYKLANSGAEFKPQKYFSIDRVFRNETLDATHLAEFHQIEGVVADYGLTLGDLIGVLHEFFKKLGIEKLRFKPAYNPYTEPSMEIFSYHEGLKKWVEVGNSGIFRPEMLLPMGLPEGVNVIAWGLSLERPTMIKYGFNNIRDLCGNRMNLKLVHDNPICRLDKDTRDAEKTLMALTEKRWDEICRKLEIINSKVQQIKTAANITTSASASNIKKSLSVQGPLDIVVSADPRFPPYSLKILCQALSKSLKKEKILIAKTHIHSSVSSVAPQLQEFISLNEGCPRSKAQYILTLVWKEMPLAASGPILSVNPTRHVQSESDILRYFSRICPNVVPYETDDKNALLVDSKIDELQLAKSGTPKEVAAKLKKILTKYSGNAVGIPEILLWSYLRRNSNVLSSCPELKSWMKKWESQPVVKAALK